MNKFLKLFLIFNLITAPVSFTKCNIVSDIYQTIKPTSIGQGAAFCTASALILYGLYQHRDKFAHCLDATLSRIFAPGTKEQYGNRALIAASIILAPYAGYKLIEKMNIEMIRNAYRG